MPQLRPGFECTFSGLILNGGNCLGALSKVPIIEIYRFLIEVPFAKEKSSCPFKYEVSGLHSDDNIIIIIIITGIYIALFQSMIKAHNKRIGKIKTGKNITKQNLKSTH